MLIMSLSLAGCHGSEEGMSANQAIGSSQITSTSNPYYASALISSNSEGFQFLGSNLPTQSIQAAGGVVFQLGDYITVVVPADSLFEPATSDVLPSAGKLLTQIAGIAKAYPESNLMVTAYTDGVGSELRQAKLSFQQARKIALALWQQGGIPNDKLAEYKFAGLADTQPIASGNTARDLGINRRVAITFYPDKEKAAMEHRLAGINVETVSQAQANEVTS